MAPVRTLRDDGKIVLTWSGSFDTLVTESWVVPPGVSSVQAECWGSGGGGGQDLINNGGGGGGEAYARSTLTLTPGETLDIRAAAATQLSNLDLTSVKRSATNLVLAEGGGIGANGSALANGAGGIGGRTANSVGTVKFAGAAGVTGGAGGGGAGAGGNGGSPAGGIGAAGTSSGINDGAGGAGGALNTNGGQPGAGAGGMTLLGTRAYGGYGVVCITYTEAGVNTSVVVPASREVITDFGLNTSVTVPAASEALADQGALASAAAFTFADALAETGQMSVLAALTSQEALAERADVTTVAAFTWQEAIGDGGLVTTLAVITADEAIAEDQPVAVLAVLTGDDALAETGGLTAVVVPTANWRRLSPGLSGTVYDESGTVPITGAQVLIFRDSNTLVATLASDASGEWALDLDPAYLYWASGWLDGATQLEDETDRHVETVETVVETGT